jgi:hypothetical protein
LHHWAEADAAIAQVQMDMAPQESSANAPGSGEDPQLRTLGRTKRSRRDTRCRSRPGRHAGRYILAATHKAHLDAQQAALGHTPGG